MKERRKMLPKKIAPKGLYLFCKKHDRWYKNDNVVKCNCKLKYKAKVHVSGTKNKSKIHNIHADDVEVAIQLFQQFKLEMKQNNFQRVNLKVKIVKPVFILDCIDDFISYKNGKNVPEHEKVTLTKETLRNLELCCEYITYALSDNNIDVKTFRFEDINPMIVGYISKFIREKVKANKTYNNYMFSIKEFAKYIHEKYYLDLVNPFKTVKTFKVKKDPRAISKSEFLRVINLANYENGWKLEKKKGRMIKTNVYRPWTIDAFYIGLFAGGRNEETVMMKWSDIKLNEEGEMSLIEIVDFKRTRLEKDGGIENIPYIKTVEFTPEFEDFLRELGYDKKKDSNEFILCPYENISRGHVMTLMSEAFTHYYSLLQSPIKKTFKHLRKTYMTKSYIETDDVKDFLIKSGHANVSTSLSHYIDMRMVMEARRKKLYELQNNSNVQATSENGDKKLE